MRKPVLSILIPVLAAPVLGAALLNLTLACYFILDLLMGRGVLNAAGRNLIFLLIIAAVSRQVFLGRFSEVFKGIYAIVPAAVTLFSLESMLNPWPVLVISLSGAAYCMIMYYVLAAQKSWIYWYTLSLLTLTMLYIYNGQK